MDVMFRVLFKNTDIYIYLGGDAAMPLSNRLPLDPVNLPQLSAQHVSQETFKIRPTLHKTTGTTRRANNIEL
jgi:hypothetical protein